MDNIWKVKETGSVGSVYVAIPNTTNLGLSPSLVVSDNTTFDASDTIISLIDD